MSVTANIHLRPADEMAAHDLKGHTAVVVSLGGDVDLYFRDRDTITALLRALHHADDLLATKEAEAMAAAETPGTDDSPEA